jgi:hypothetical protein
MTQRFDFANQDYLRDPAAGLARLRAAGALVDVRFPIVGKVWITTTQEMASPAQGQRDLHAAPGRRRCCRAAVVDARDDPHACR